MICVHDSKKEFYIRYFGRNILWTSGKTNLFNTRKVVHRGVSEGSLNKMIIITKIGNFFFLIILIITNREHYYNLQLGGRDVQKNMRWQG